MLLPPIGIFAAIKFYKSGNADIFAGLKTLAENIGDAAVRNRGTIGGSLANNDPAACYPAVALSTGATIVTNSREISADDFFNTPNNCRTTHCQGS